LRPTGPAGHIPTVYGSPPRPIAPLTDDQPATAAVTAKRRAIAARISEELVIVTTNYPATKVVLLVMRPTTMGAIGREPAW
jgi:hypothetical protein